jgi:aldose 1-epimerase
MRVYELATDRLRARVLDYGATLISLQTIDRHGRMGDVVLGFDDIERYRGPHPYFGGTIGRYANRIARGRFVLDGEQYQLNCNNGPNHLHGGHVGFDRVQWQAVQHGNRVELGYRSRDGEEGYPGTLAATVTFSVEGSSLRIEYAATCDRPTVVNLTNHSYFNLGGRGTIHDHVVRIAASRYLPVDHEVLPTGQPAPVAGTEFDFNRPRALHSPAFDHTFILEGDVELSEPTSGRVLRIVTSQPGIQFYTGNLLDGTIVGKNGERYVRHAGLCLEPQHYPDSPNRPEFPSTALRPGMEYREHAVYAFATMDPAKTQ